MIKKYVLVLFLGILSLLGGCYFQGKKELGGGYFEYQGKIYFNSTGNELMGVDKESFIFLYNDKLCGDIKAFAKDKNAVYGESLVLFSGFDYDTLTGIEGCQRGCFKDKNASFYHDNTPNNVYKRDTQNKIPDDFLIEDRVPIGAKKLGGGYFEYQGKIYLNSTGLVLESSDSKTFTFLYKDKNCGDGPQVFAKDKNAVYGESRVLFTGFDYDTLTGVEGCQRGCFKDKDATYYREGCPGDQRGCIYKKDTGFLLPTKKIF